MVTMNYESHSSGYHLHTQPLLTFGRGKHPLPFNASKNRNHGTKHQPHLGSRQAVRHATISNRRNHRHLHRTDGRRNDRRRHDVYVSRLLRTPSKQKHRGGRDDRYRPRVDHGAVRLDTRVRVQRHHVSCWPSGTYGVLSTLTNPLRGVLVLFFGP